jgi:predicted chitinase
MKYKFEIQIINQNRFQIGINDYRYSYRNINQFESTSGDLGQKLGYELEDYYLGNFFTFSGVYPDLRGPGGGGYSASSFRGEYSSFTNIDTIDGGKSFIMDFDKNNLDEKVVESNVRFIIESAFQNSMAKNSEVYIDTVFTRDRNKPAEPNSIKITKVNGVDVEVQNDRYTPNGKTYSVSNTLNYQLTTSKEISTNNYLITYLVKEIIPTPKKEDEIIENNVIISNNVVTKSESPKISSDVFNVEKKNTFFNKNFGNLTIVENTLAIEKSSTTKTDDFIFNINSIEESIDSEFTESEFSGSEEDLISFFDDGVNLNIELINDIKGVDPEKPDNSIVTDNYKYPISRDVDSNIKTIIKISKESGITNKFSIAAMLAICKKESGILPQSEYSYAKSTAQRIKSIFKRFRKFSDSEVDRIKNKPEEFFNIIYGDLYENGPKEGFKYRGRGLNQITFKGNYRKYKTLSGYDIISDPDLLNRIDVAAKCLAEYFKNNFNKAPNDIKSRYNFTDINSFKNLNDATGAFYHANAGWGKSYSEIVADSTGGRAKSFKYVGNLYETYKDQM